MRHDRAAAAAASPPFKLPGSSLAVVAATSASLVHMPRVAVAVAVAAAGAAVAGGQPLQAFLNVGAVRRLGSSDNTLLAASAALSVATLGWAWMMLGVAAGATIVKLFRRALDVGVGSTVNAVLADALTGGGTRRAHSGHLAGVTQAASAVGPADDPGNGSGLLFELRLTQTPQRDGSLDHSVSTAVSLPRLLQLAVHELAGQHHRRMGDAQPEGALSVALTAALRLIIAEAVDDRADGWRRRLRHERVDLASFLAGLEDRRFRIQVPGSAAGSITIAGRPTLTLPRGRGADRAWSLDIMLRVDLPLDGERHHPHLWLGSDGQDPAHVRVTFGEPNVGVRVSVLSLNGKIQIWSDRPFHPTFDLTLDRALSVLITPGGVLHAQGKAGAAGVTTGAGGTIEAALTCPIYVTAGELQVAAMYEHAVDIRGDVFSIALGAAIQTFAMSFARMEEGVQAALGRVAQQRVAAGAQGGINRLFWQLHRRTAHIGLSFSFFRLQQRLALVVNDADGRPVPPQRDAPAAPWLRLHGNLPQRGPRP